MNKDYNDIIPFGDYGLENSRAWRRIRNCPEKPDPCMAVVPEGDERHAGPDVLPLLSQVCAPSQINSLQLQVVHCNIIKYRAVLVL